VLPGVHQTISIFSTRSLPRLDAVDNWRDFHKVRARTGDDVN
jgi:hypothetical protein